jgi:heptosyltransferase-2
LDAQNLEILNHEKILVIQTAFLGDAILTLPMIQKLHEKFINCSISVVCIPSTKEVFDSSPYVENVIVFDKRGKQSSLWSFIKFTKFIRGQSYTRIYSPHRSFRSSLLVLFSNVEKTFGFDNASLSFTYLVKRKYQSNIHEVARQLELIGYDTSNEKWKVLPFIKIPESTKDKIRDIIHTYNLNNIVAIAPCSVWKTKIYPMEYFIEVIKSLTKEGYCVVLIGGGEDRILCDDIANQFDSMVKSFAGNLSIVESIELIRNSKMLLSNDSAPTHMGMVADIPTLTIYCSTVFSFGFYPYNKRSTFISYNDLKCKPCGIHGHHQCPIKTFDCAYKLLPGFVIKQIHELLSR